MNDVAEPSWELIREFGLEYGEDADTNFPVALKCPVTFEFLAGAGYLLVDELPVAGLPLRTHCRTLLLSQTRQVVFDSLARGMDDGYGCVMRCAGIAILRRIAREILVLSHSGESVARVDLRAISDRQPRVHCWTDRGTFLVNFVTLGEPYEIVEMDLKGRVLWRFDGPARGGGIPSSMQLLANNSLLIANEGAHVVEELRRDGSTSICWGRENQPSAREGHLCNPKWARRLDDGTLLVADAYNHRCLAIDAGGRMADIQPWGGSFFAPTCITRLPNANYLVCDGGLRCAFELDQNHRIVWQMGTATARRRHLSFPRSVQYVDDGKYLVADTAHNRIVTFEGRELREWPVNDGHGLFWPRAARRTARGTLLVADGRNSRVLELSAHGATVRQLRHVRYEGRSIELQDPHDIRLLPNANLLITDSMQNLVLETDWNGHAAWVIGRKGGVALKDPHSAQFLPDGRILISDSSNQRIVFVDVRARVSRELTQIPGLKDPKLGYPRYAELAQDGTLVIVDSLNSRVLAAKTDGSLLWELSRIPGSPIPYLHFPRWVHLFGRDELVISDHFNHRVLHLRRR